MELSELGWRESLQHAAAPYSDLTPARVFRHDRERYIVHDGTSLRGATVLGRLLYESDDPADLPAVGDWVMIQHFDSDAIIHQVLPRFSAFYRKEAGRLTRRQVIASNIDMVFLVSGLDHDFNVRRIERYVVQASGSGARPVIVLNKVDLRDDIETVVAEVQRVASGIDIIVLSAKEGLNLDALRLRIEPGRTVAFLGSSGVGKSSLVNRLLGDDVFATGSIREDDSRGRHTTTHRELALIPGGGLVIDTPGLRELQLWGEEEDLEAVFEDIIAMSRDCRFNDCQHHTEHDCAVLAALESGDLDQDRFESFLKLRKEIAWLETRQSEVAAQSARKRDKDFGKMMKEMKRHNPKR